MKKFDLNNPIKISIFSLVGGLFVLPFFGVTTITWMYIPIVIGTTFLLLSLVTL